MRRRRLSVRTDPDPVDASGGPNVGTSACWAPHSALYLRPDGFVHACCTTGFAVGAVTGPRRESLREIWDGAALREQRRLLEAGRFDLGCQECEWVAATAGREASLAANFDRFADGAPHRYPKHMDLALSNRCNLQCVMCNGELSSTIRAQREGRPPLASAYDDRFFDELDEFLPHLEGMQFKGGEPFLAPENRRIWDRLIEMDLRPEITVTTNGTVLNEQVERYITELRMNVIVSVDAVSVPVLESIRVGVDGAKLWSNIDRFQELADVARRGMTLSFCLLRSNWMELVPFLAEAERRGVEGNVVVVTHPREQNLFGADRVELQGVLRELEDDDRRFQVGGTSEHARARVLDQLRSHLDPSGEFAVRGGGSPLKPVDGSVKARLQDELTARHGRPPVVLQVVDGVVLDVDSPSWADWMEPGSFVGCQLSEIGLMLESNVGPVTSNVVHSGIPMVEAIEVIVRGPGLERRLVVHDLVDATSGEERVFLSDVTDGRCAT